MTENKDQQVRHVVEGVALGVLAQRVEAVAEDKMMVELAFNHAWRRWRSASQFPAFATGDPGNLFWLGMRKSGRRRGPRVAAWETGAWVVPYLTLDGWTVNEALDVHADERASSSAWCELGSLFVARLGPEGVKHHGDEARS